jgi:LCP family protein required for cell wall assembly
MPPVPETPGPARPDETAEANDAATRSRADLQADLRKAHKKEQKHRHRWRRRSLYALSGIVLLAALGVGGLYAYTTYRFDQIKKIHSKHLVAEPPGPFNILMVGSDSRAFVSNSTQANAFGNEQNAGGQRSDVTMVVRFDPAAKTVHILSIPRDLWVDIPGNGPNSGLNRINAAYDSGPDLLVQTIEKDLGIPINHYMSVDFPGFSGMVDALGGINMDFPTEVKDQYTGLHVTTTGCQTINGTVALQLVRSRHLYYMNSDGYWTYDGNSDFSRIQRQDAFFRAVLAKVSTLGVLNPITINNFVGAAVSNLTIDDALTKGDLINIANDFKGLPKKNLVTETLPTVGFTTAGGAAVLKEAQPYAQEMIDAFNTIGTVTPKAHSGSTTTSTPPVSPAQVDVQVLNASTVSGIAHTTATALGDQGFQITEIGNAATPLAAGKPSEIQYGPSGYAAALSLGSALGGPVTYVADSGLSGNTVSLLIAGSALSVHAPSATTTTTTIPGVGTTATTIPADVVTNTQPEPWNPYPCTLGAAQASPKTSTTVEGSKK